MADQAYGRGVQMIVALQGGLGNQLFQWAFGVSVAKSYPGEKLQFTRFRVDQDRKRDYALGAFGFNLEFVNHEPNPYYDSGSYDSGVYTAPANTSFIGYWQTEKYFNSSLIRGMFGSKRISAMNWVKEIFNHLDSVAIHIRRGDYISESHTQKFHGNLSMEYYTKGIDCIRKRNPSAKFFIFSDDKQWCKQNFLEHIVVENTSDFDDLWLMSLCQHAIIANSAFSWWSAWLGDEKNDRIVIAPQQWFKDPDMQSRSRDIVPERWQKI
jgi:hypothetical protein